MMKRKATSFAQSSSSSSESPRQFVQITRKIKNNSGEACASVQSNSSTEQVSSASAKRNLFGKIQFVSNLSGAPCTTQYVPPPLGSNPFGHPPSGTRTFGHPTPTPTPTPPDSSMDTG
jgi:hypothetical protein